MADGTVRIDGNSLRLAGGVQVRFIRTLRLPETGTHPLPRGSASSRCGAWRTTRRRCPPSGWRVAG